MTETHSLEASRSSASWWPLAVITAAHLMAILDTTVMFVALPSAQHALHLSDADREWVLTAYTLAFGGLLLLGGRLADRLGARRSLLVGVVGFAAASAFGGVSVNAVMLIGGRALQGAFAALLVSSTKSLLITVYREERQRVRAIGVFSATLTAGAAVGLVLGGLLTGELGWRWCLYVNVALSVFVITGIARVLPPLPSHPDIKLDMTSALLSCGGMVALVYGLGEAASRGWSSAVVIGTLTAAVALLVAFVIRQARTAHPLLPLRIVVDRNRGGALIALVFNALSTFGMMLILTYQLQGVMAYSPLASGLALLPFALAAAVAAALVAPRAMARFSARWLIVGGILLSAAGLAPLIWLSPASHYLPLIFGATLIEGFGTGLAAPPALSTALRAVLPPDTGSASAVSSAASQLGSSSALLC